MFLYSTVSTLNPALGVSFREGFQHLPVRLMNCQERITVSPVDGSGSGLTNRGNGGDDFTELELVQDGGLTGGVKTDHQNAHLLAAP